MQLQLLPYHIEVADRLQALEPDLWNWFASDQFAEKYKEATTADLLRNAIRLDRNGANGHRYELAEKARDTLGIAAPIALYQSQDSTGSPNAFLVYTPGEIVIAFVGRILELLESDVEILDLLGHELSHYKLFTESQGRYHVVDRLLGWLMQRDNCPPEFAETWRRFRLNTEIYCDIGGLIACGDRDATVRGLVKTLADFKDADAASYLDQARELMALGPGASRGTTHPELHVRALAVANVVELEPPAFTAMVHRLISGPLELGGLDLLDQQRLADLTRTVLDRVLSQKAARHEHAIIYARQMYNDYAVPAEVTQVLPNSVDELSPSTVDYLCYVLLDLSTVDESGSYDAITVAAATADELGIGARFRDLARQELKGRRAILAGLMPRAA